jgi:hypothetical protein
MSPIGKPTSWDKPKFSKKRVKLLRRELTMFSGWFFTLKIDGYHKW